MKIVHICKKYPPSMGGDATVVDNLQKQQRAAHHTVLTVTSNCDDVAETPVVYKFGLVDTPSNLDAITLKRLLSLPMLGVKLFAILRKHRPDVIHTHSIDLAFFASFAARFYHIPLVHTFHIVTFYDPEQLAIRRKTELWLAKGAHLQAITAPNRYDVEKLRAAGLSQTVLLPNGVDLTFWRKVEHDQKNKLFTFLTIGRLEPQKGYEYLIKAAGLLASTSGEPFQVIIVGEGSQKAVLQKHINDLQLNTVVSLAGGKNPHEVRQLLSKTDAAIFPSLYETTPLTLLEAWAAGVPTIITPVGIVRDAPVNFEAAYIVLLKDEQSLTKAMTRCMSDKSARSSIAASGYLEAKKYAWPVIAQSLEAIYRRIQ